MLTRRQFMKYSAIAGAAAALPLKFGVGSAEAFYQSPNIPLFGTTLRGVGPGGIPVALPGVLPAPVTGVTHYQMGIVQFQDRILPPGFGKTTLWGYAPTRGLGGNITPTHLGGIIVAKGRSPGWPGDKAQPIQITFHNLLLVNKHIIPVDMTIPGADKGINRTAVHFHGGLVPWISDGGPFDWFKPSGQHGDSFLNNKVLNPIHLPGAAEYYYPMNQSARFGWYHDHAVGITRINAYAGIASGLIIRDGFEKNLVTAYGLPDYIEAGGNEIPLVFQDKIFVGNDINTVDPNWKNVVAPIATKPGSLWYAHAYDPTRWELGPGLTPPDPSCIPEFFGDTMLVNGTTFPQATVQARRYRLRLLNACNARFLNLQLYIADGSLDGITLGADGNPTNEAFVNAATGDSSWLQIGTEGGFLAYAAKVPSNVPFLITDPDFLLGGPSLNPSLINKSLLIGLAERPDVIVDFSSVPTNPDGSYKSVIVYNDAPSPFPSGDDRNDYFPGWNVGTGVDGVGNPVNGTTLPGFGPNTRVLMRFNVVARASTDPGLSIVEGFDLSTGIDLSLLPSWGDTNVPPALVPRVLTLNESKDEYGRLIQTIGSVTVDPNTINGSPYFGSALYTDPLPARSVGDTAEIVTDGDTEVWEIYNATGDTHPMHFHLVNVQLINRQAFDPGTGYPYTPSGPVIPPASNEIGWKETVPMYPGTVTRVIMNFDMQQALITDSKGKLITTRARPLIGQLPIDKGKVPDSPRTGGAEYVWHCHILEHEEHDMMHALVVNPKP